MNLALGTAQWGFDYGVANRHGKPPLRTLEQLLQVAVDAGVTALDTAHAYGESEARIGAIVGGDSPFRIVTKLSPAVGDAADPAAATRRSIEESLSRLRRDRIDTLLLHRPEHRHAAEGAIWRTLLTLRDEGVLGRLGISAVAPDDAFAALDDPEVSTIQLAASVLDRRLERAGFFSLAVDAGKEVFARSVFLQGAAGMLPEEMPAHLAQLVDPVKKLRAIASAQGLSVHELCLRYIWTMDRVVPVVGCERAEQVTDNVDAWKRGPLAPELLSQLREASGALPAGVLDPSRWGEGRA